MKTHTISAIVRLAVPAIVALLVASCETEPKLSEATVSKEKAQATALARVRGGKVKDAELEREHGRLIWSFDISQPKTTDLREIAVDAKTGAIVSEETETAAHEMEEEAKVSARH